MQKFLSKQSVTGPESSVHYKASFLDEKLLYYA